MSQRRYTCLIGGVLLLLFGSLAIRGRMLLAVDQLARNYPFRVYPPLSEMGPFVNSWSMSDSILGSFPALAYIHRSIASGSLPLWNPLEGLGLPAAASSGLGYLFPVHWLTYGLLQPAIAWHVELIAILAISSLSAYAVFRRVTNCAESASLAATAWAFGGWSGAYLQLPSYAWTLALFPLTLWGIERARERRPFAFLHIALTVGLMLTVGHLQVIAACMMVVIAWTLWRAREHSFAIAASLMASLAMASYHLVPMAELLSLSERPRVPLPALLNVLLLPREYLCMAFPTLLGQPSDNFYFGSLLAHPVINAREHCVYSGVITLWLAVLAAWRGSDRSSRPVAAAVGAGLLLAGSPFLYGALCSALPPLTFFTPTRFLPLVLFGQCLLGAQGWASLRKRPLDKKEAQVLAGILAVYVAGACYYIVPASLMSLNFQSWLLEEASRNFAVKPPYFEGDFAPVFVSRVRAHFSFFSPAIAVSLLVVLGSIALLLSQKRKNLPFRPVFALLCLELAMFFSVMNTTVSSSAYFPANPDIDYLSQGTTLSGAQPPDRVMSLGTGPFPNLLLVEGISNLEAYETAHPGDYRAVIDALNRGYQLQHQEGNYVGDETLEPATMDVLGLGKIYNAPGTWVAGYGEPTYQGRGIVAQDRPNTLRGFLIDKYRVVNRAEAMKEIMAKGFDPRAEALLSSPPSFAAPAGSATFLAATPTLFKAERIEWDLESARPTMLVLTDLHYPGWQASVNNQPVPIVKAYGYARAVELPPGRAHVVFRFVPTSYPYTPWLSGITVLLVLGLEIRRWRSLIIAQRASS